MSEDIKLTFFEIRSALDFMFDLQKESDRAAVIISAAKMDTYLEQILQKFLLQCPAAKDELFDDSGPLSTFNMKTALAYRLGLIDSTSARALHLVRKIRNDFAHEVSESSLNAGAHRNRITSLVALFEDLAPFQGIRMVYLEEKPTSASDDFRIIACILTIYLTAVLNMIKTLIPQGVPISAFRTRESGKEKQ